MAITVTYGDSLFCVVCGRTFPDAGTHPLTCGRRQCAIQAG